jgi:branched-chain amino acid transport system permease protein
MWDRAKGIIGGIILAAGLVAIDLALRAAGKEFYLTQLTMSIYYAVVVLGLSLLMGYAGQISLGHGAFFAIGGYTTAILTTSNFLPWQDKPLVRALGAARVFVTKQDVFGDPLMAVAPWAAFIAAMVFTFAVAMFIGYSALRLKGHYLAMATLGFGLIVQSVVRGSAFTGASDGISSVPPFPLFGLAISGKSALRTQNYYIAGAVLLVVIVLLWNLLHSRIGRALQAIHDRETAANAMGIDTSRYKLKAFVTSALLAAIAGVLFTHYTGGIGPSEAGAIKSVRYVALAAAGGMANIWAVAVTSITLNFLSLRGWFGTYDNAVFGVILIAIVSIAPDGPAKQIHEWARRFAGRAKTPTEDTDAAA